MRFFEYAYFDLYNYGEKFIVTIMMSEFYKTTVAVIRESY